MVTIEVTQRRARLARRHALATPERDVATVADALVGLHSSDPVTPYLAELARVGGFAIADLEHALYDRRSVVRVLGMRRTLFVVPHELAAVMDAACARSYAAAERTRLFRMLEDQAITKNAKRWLPRVQRDTLAALASRGEATAGELTADVPALGRKLRFGVGKKWETTVGVSTRMLYLLAMEGRILRTRPLGTWVSSQYRWARADDWLEDGLADLDPETARTELARRYLRAYGPATLTDLKWWTGWGLRDSRAALASLDAVEVDLEGAVGYLHPDDLDLVDEPGPWAALLPGLDSTVMGWKERDWYLGEHAGPLFDTNGNAGCTVWLDGRVVGGWAQRADGSIAVELLERIAPAGRRRVDAEAQRLADWLGDTRITGRFRTPLERELAT